MPKIIPAISTFLELPGATLLLVLILLPLLTNCATSTKTIPTAEVIYNSPSPEELQAIHSPSFVIRDPQLPHNLIGSPSARIHNQSIEIFTDYEIPAIYYESQLFSTENGLYRNHVYRIHFEKVPFSFFEPHLTTGNNPGILIIYTCDMAGRPLLVTTVHTCGCYLAFFPTDNLPAHAYPENWPQTTQHIYGYDLPAILRVASLAHSAKMYFTLESGSHRISNVTAVESGLFQKDRVAVPLKLLPMSRLYNIAYGEDGQTTTFFELEGNRKGYVRNNLKILERLLISWWAFDLRVGEDKAYGNDDRSSVPLYTSLKFWHRKASDLKDFPGFLSYWGWKL